MDELDDARGSRYSRNSENPHDLNRVDWNEMPFLTWPGIKLLEAEDGRSVMELLVEDHHRGGGGSEETVNGGIISYMFDGLLGAAVYSSWDGEVTGQVTMTLTTQFVGQIRARERVRGEAHITRRGRSTVFAEGRVFDDEGDVGAFCTGIYKLFRERS